MTDAEIRKSGRSALAAKYPMSQVSRAYEKGETQGFIKISVDAETKQILGAAILGVGGDEVVHALSHSARTGRIGDGKIFVFDVADAIRIRNNDSGEAAL